MKADQMVADSEQSKRQPCVIGLGEVLWDMLPAGKQMGGAPANFAFHAASLGADALTVSCVGRDELGGELLQQMRALGLRVDGVAVDPDALTGTVRVTLDQQGTPSYLIEENVAWDKITATDAARAAAVRADAICFGSLAQRHETSRTAIQSLVAATPAEAWRIFDVNLRQHYFNRDILEKSLQLANAVKLNDAELPVLAKIFDLTGDAREQITTLTERFGLKLAALTRGAEGSLLWQGGRWSERGPSHVEVRDTVGAGDAFTAALAIGLLRKLDLENIHDAAAAAAAFVCAHAGATPILPPSVGRILTIHRQGKLRGK